MNWLYAMMNHKHRPADGDSSQIEYGDISSAPRTFGVLSRVAASSNTVTVSAGIEAVVWNGDRYVTARVTRDATLTGDATSNSAEYLYLSTGGVSKSMTAPVFSSTDGFWISGTDRTLRWIGVILPRTGTAGAYTYHNTVVSGFGANQSTQSLPHITLFNSAMTGSTNVSVSIAKYVVADAVTSATISILTISPSAGYVAHQRWDSKQARLLASTWDELTTTGRMRGMATIAIFESSYIAIVNVNVAIAEDVLHTVSHRW